MNSWKTILTVACAALIFAGTTAYGTGFRTRAAATGTPNWNANNLWEINTGSGWTETDTYPADNTAPVTVRSGPNVQVNVTDAAAASLTIDTGGDVTILSTGLLEVAGDVLVNDPDSLQIQGELLLSEAPTFSDPSGSNSIQMTADSAVIRIRDSGETFTLPVTFTLHGNGQILGAGNFQNNGVVQADAAGTLKIAPTGTVDDTTTNTDRWKVNTNASARLLFDAAIGTLNTLDCNFVVSTGELEIAEAMTCNGRLEQSGGLVDVQQTTTMGSDANSRFANITGGSIVVAINKTLTHN